MAQVEIDHGDKAIDFPKSESVQGRNTRLADHVIQQACDSCRCRNAVTAQANCGAYGRQRIRCNRKALQLGAGLGLGHGPFLATAIGWYAISMLRQWSGDTFPTPSTK